MPRHVRTSKRLDTLTDHELEARERALHAVALMRREGWSLTKAAKVAGTKPATVRRYAPSALTQRGRRWAATPNDRITRRQMTVVIAINGAPTRAVVETRSSKQASEIGRHNADVGALLSVRTTPDARDAARARLEARHGTRAGLRGFLPDDSLIDDPQFFGVPEVLVDSYDTLDLGDIDYGSSASTRAVR